MVKLLICGRFQKDLIFYKRYKVQTQVLDGYLGQLADLLVGYFLVLVEKK